MALSSPASLRRFNRTTLAAIHHRIDGRAMMRDVRRLVATDRFNSFDCFLQTAGTIADLYEKGGARVETWSVPTGTADGSGAWVIQEASDIRGASVDVISPVRRRIADFENNPWTVVQWSAGTPPRGITCDLVAVESWEELRSVRRDSLRGRLILMSLPPWHAAHEIARTGADGVLTFLPNGTGSGAQPRARQLPDATEWTKLGWGGVPMEHAGSGIVAVNVSPRTGAWLQNLVARGTVTVRVRVDVRRHQGMHQLVSGIVRGRDESAGEVWALAHSAEPGAADNASGVAACVAAAQALEDGIRDGDLSRPLRSIRFLNGYECYSFFHFLEHSERRDRPLAGLLVDTIGLEPSRCQGRLNWHPSVGSSAQFVNDVGEAVIRAALALDNPGYRIVRQPWVSTEDTLLGDPAYGFPCPWMNTHYREDQVAFDEYHTSFDTPDILDQRGLRVCATAAAGYLLYIADAEAREALEMARASTASLTAELRSGLGTRPREWADFRVLQHDVTMAELQRCAQALERRVLIRQLDELRMAVHELAAAYGGSPRRRQVRSGTGAAAAGQRVPRRRRMLAPASENLRPGVRAALSASGLGREALFWANGKRTIAEIAALHSMETGKVVTVSQITAFFEALKTAGYVRLGSAAH